MEKKLLRDPNNRLLGGVSSGIANYLGWDASVVRLLWVVAFLIGWGATPFIYAILWIIMPKGVIPKTEAGEECQSTNLETPKYGCLSTALKVCFILFLLFAFAIIGLIIFVIATIGIATIGGIISGEVTSETMQLWINAF